MTTLFDKIKEVTELSATSGFEAPVQRLPFAKTSPHL